MTSRNTSPSGLDFLCRMEGVVLHVYKDQAGLATIGVGHLIKPGEHFSTITREEALALLASDVKKCEIALNRCAKVELTQNQFDALISWSFNCGTGVLSNSGVMRELNAGRYENVPAKLLEWSKIRVNGQMVTSQGLYDRRKAEGELFARPDDEGLPPHEQDALDADSLALAQSATAMSIDRIVSGIFSHTDDSTQGVA